MYWEIWGKKGKCSLQPHECVHSTHGKLYIFGKVRSVVFHSYYEDINLAVIKVSPIFSVC